MYEQGNRSSKAFLNAARLSALLLFDFKALNKDVNKVVPHNFWTGKNCPRLLLENGNVGNKWREFLRLVQQELNTIENIGPDILNEIESDADVDNDTDNVINTEVPNDFHIDENGGTQETTDCIPVETELYSAIVQQAQRRGVNPETLANLWLQQKVDEYKTIS